MQPDRLDAEIDANYDFFRRNLSRFLEQHPRRYALLKRAAVVDFFDTVTEAARAGRETFADGIYSVQQVIDEPVDLGFFSHAGR